MCGLQKNLPLPVGSVSILHFYQLIPIIIDLFGYCKIFVNQYKFLVFTSILVMRQAKNQQSVKQAGGRRHGAAWHRGGGSMGLQ